MDDYFNDRENVNVYFDIAVANIFANSYINNTSKYKLWLSKKKERGKHMKNRNDPNVIPLAIESMGAIGPEFKKVLQRLADALSLRTNIPYSIMMQRIRSNVVAEMMRYNVDMMISSMGNL